MAWEGAGLPVTQVPLIPVEFPLPKDAPVVVHCAHGDRSTVGISVLERRGYRNLMLLDGGFSAWETAGYKSLP